MTKGKERTHIGKPQPAKRPISHCMTIREQKVVPGLVTPTAIGFQQLFPV
jgi:hypothetical protein